MKVETRQANLRGCHHCLSHHHLIILIRSLLWLESEYFSNFKLELNTQKIVLGKEAFMNGPSPLTRHLKESVYFASFYHVRLQDPPLPTSRCGRGTINEREGQRSQDTRLASSLIWDFSDSRTMTQFLCTNY